MGEGSNNKVCAFKVRLKKDIPGDELMFKGN